MNKLFKIGTVVVTAMIPLTGMAYATFPDVSSDYKYYDAVNYLQEEGIASGFSNGEFGPEKIITRGEFTKIIVETTHDLSSDDTYLIKNTKECFKGDETGRYYTSGFPDMEDYLLNSEGNSTGNVFSKYTCVAKEKGIINGASDGNFYPDKPITIGEASKIISNAYKYTDSQSGPEGDIFKPFIDELSNRNALPSEILSINSLTTRGQMSEIIYRLDNNINDKVSVNYDYLNNLDSIEDNIVYFGMYEEEYAIFYTNEIARYDNSETSGSVQIHDKDYLGNENVEKKDFNFIREVYRTNALNISTNGINYDIQENTLYLSVVDYPENDAFPYTNKVLQIKMNTDYTIELFRKEHDVAYNEHAGQVALEDRYNKYLVISVYDCFQCGPETPNFTSIINIETLKITDLGEVTNVNIENNIVFYNNLIYDKENSETYGWPNYKSDGILREKNLI